MSSLLCVQGPLQMHPPFSHIFLVLGPWGLNVGMLSVNQGKGPSWVNCRPVIQSLSTADKEFSGSRLLSFPFVPFPSETWVLNLLQLSDRDNRGSLIMDSFWASLCFLTVILLSFSLFFLPPSSLASTFYLLVSLLLMQRLMVYERKRKG